MPSAVVIGASSGVGLALARELAQKGHSLTIVARRAIELEAAAADLKARFSVECHPVVQDISSPELDVDQLVAACVRRQGPLDCVYVPAGANSTEDIGGNPAAIVPMVAVNFLGPARLAAAFGRAMAAQGRGAVVLFSSIAAAAPRSRNGAYSAAKAALEVYAKALRADLEPRGVRVHVIALGYVDTRLSQGMKLLFPKASPEAVASFAVARAAGPGGRRHFPAFWWWITMTLRHLPWFLYRRLRF